MLCAYSAWNTQVRRSWPLACSIRGLPFNRLTDWRGTAPFGNEGAPKALSARSGSGPRSGRGSLPLTDLHFIQNDREGGKEKRNAGYILIAP